MEIKYLPEISEPQADDWLIIQRGDLTGKIKYSNLNIRLPDPDPNPTPIGDEDDMYMGINPPDNPTPGKLWGELDGNDLLTQSWIWQKNSITNNYAWMSEVKTITFPVLSNGSQEIVGISAKHNYLIKEFYVSAGYPPNAIVSLHYGKYSGVFSGDTKISELNFSFDIHEVMSVNQPFLLETYFNNGEAAWYNDLLGVKVEQNSTNSSFYANAIVFYQLVRR